jgi:hypothetical protein
MQPVDGGDVELHQLLAARDEHRQHSGRVIRPDGLQILGPEPSDGDGIGIRAVGLAATPATECPDPSGQLRRHVQDLFVLRDQPLRQAGPDTPGPLDSPDVIAPATGELLHLAIADAVVREPLLGQDLLLAINHHQGVARLVGIDADDNSTHARLLLRRDK